MLDLINEIFNIPGERMTGQDLVIGICVCAGFFAFVWSFTLWAIGFGLGV